MIAKLYGKLDEIHQDKCIINVNGVGYLVFLSSKTSDNLKKLEKNSEISLIIETLVKEDAFELYGFLEQSEKSWFLELTKVQGVGNKMAQKILSLFNANDLTNALLTKDIKAFSKVSGVGPKLANRIIIELKDTPKKLGISGNINPDNYNNQENNSPLAIDALSALENLGYKKYDCQKIINQLLDQKPEITLENLITKTLQNLSK